MTTPPAYANSPRIRTLRRSRPFVHFGFVEAGTMREAEWLYDHFVDNVVYSMLDRDWPAT